MRHNECPAWPSAVLWIYFQTSITFYFFYKYKWIYSQTSTTFFFFIFINIFGYISGLPPPFIFLIWIYLDIFPDFHHLLFFLNEYIWIYFQTSITFNFFLNEYIWTYFQTSTTFNLFLWIYLDVFLDFHHLLFLFHSM